MLAALVIVALAYLLGSISFAVVVSRAFGLPDPHAYGSGNPGATNVLRTGNRKAALLTLLGDGLKGFVAVYAAQRLAAPLGAPGWTVPTAALAVFLGHLYPVFHGFRGGKGVATGAGIVFALHWPLGLVLTVIWLTMAYGFKISSLAALVAAHTQAPQRTGTLDRPLVAGVGVKAPARAAPRAPSAAARRTCAHPVGPRRGASHRRARSSRRCRCRRRGPGSGLVRRAARSRR